MLRAWSNASDRCPCERRLVGFGVFGHGSMGGAFVFSEFGEGGSCLEIGHITRVDEEFDLDGKSRIM